MKRWLARWLRRIANWLAPPSVTLSDIVTETLRNRSQRIADRVTEDNALLRKLRERGRVEPIYEEWR